MVGIISPYAFCDTTAAAINVANLARNLGNDVQFFSRLPPGVVDRQWNNKTSRFSFYHSPACDIYIHFEFDAKLRKGVDTLTDSARHVLVPTLDNLSKVDCARFVPDQHHLIVCSTHKIRQHLIHECFRGTDDDRLITLPFPATGTPPIRVAGRRLNLTLVTGRSTDTDIFDFMLQNLLQLDQRQVHVQVLGLRAWSDRERRILSSCGVLTHRPKTFTELDRILLQTDWTISTLETAEFGSLLSRSIGCGAPVIAFNTTPFSDVITDGVNGFLIEKPLDSFELSAGRMLDKLYTCIRDPNILIQVRTSMRRQKASAEFDRTWSAILEIGQ